MKAVRKRKRIRGHLDHRLAHVEGMVTIWHSSATECAVPGLEAFWPLYIASSRHFDDKLPLALVFPPSITGKRSSRATFPRSKLIRSNQKWQNSLWKNAAADFPKHDFTAQILEKAEKQHRLNMDGIINLKAGRLWACLIIAKMVACLAVLTKIKSVTIKAPIT